MEISILFFIVFNVNLVLTDDNAPMENNIIYQETQKGVSEPLNNPEIDQIAESSQSISKTYNGGGSKNIQVNNPNQGQFDIGKNRPEGYDDQNMQQVAQNSPRDSSQNAPVNNLEILQPALSQGYHLQGQPIYVQYPLPPIRILGAEASPLYQNQLYQNEGQTLGFSSYVEHLSQKDEEEIKSALKEGSVGDIKRLVPKSGISFKIYKNEKNNQENPKTQTETDYLQYSQLHHKIKVEPPITQQNIQNYQTVYKQQQPEQQTYQQLGFENSHLSQSDAEASHSQNHQSVNEQTHYFIQPEINSQKTLLEINGKTSSHVKPRFKINVNENNYNKATSTAEYNSLVANRGSKHGLTDISNYPKQWKFDTKLEGSQKSVKKIKPVLQYEIDPIAQAERNKVYFTQTHQDGSHIDKNFNQQKTVLVESQKGSANANYQSSFIGKVHQNGYLSEKGYSDQNIGKTRQTGEYADNTKQEQNKISNHLGTNVYADSQVYKGSQNEYFLTTIHPDNEPAKSSQHLIAHLDTKNIQSFDHQKALQGSTSFDIKNAIDTTGSLAHQINHATTSDSHSFDDLNKQQFAYIVPKIPTSTVAFDSKSQDTPIVEGHQIKDFGIAPPQLPYHSVSSPEVNGKFFHQPQTIVWSSEHLKQGNALTAADLQQPLIRLHLPKEEHYHNIKTPNVELPTNSLSHVSHQQKQPYVVHYGTPLVKFPQEIHFQPKTKIRIQNQGDNFKLGQPLTIDWSLFKSTFPNFNVNSLVIKPEMVPHPQEMGKKIVPILIRKRKNRSNNKQEIGMVVYGKVNNKRRPTKPSHRQEKNVRINLLPEASNNVKQFEPKRERKNEFSVSASYKVDRSFKTK